MAQSKSSKAFEFDSIVIGSGIGGLIAAHQLEGTGRRVALIEALDILGGSCRPSTSKVGILDHGLKLLPASPESLEVLQWLGGILGREIESKVIDEPPVTFADGKFKPFVGFGAERVNTAGEIGAYAQNSYLSLSSTPKDWVPVLTGGFTGTVATQSYVTKMQVDDEFVIEIIVNGSKRYSAREVLFCAAPHALPKFLPEAQTPAKLKSKLHKGEYWTSLNLDLVHAAVVTESQAVHILKGANEEPCAGLFYPPKAQDNGRILQVSQWLTLVPRDIADDPEVVAGALKQIKRQVKRAYESSLDGLLQERILVNPSSHGDLLGFLPADGRWPRLQNLWLVSGFLDPGKNLLGSLRQVRRTLASMVGEPIVAVSHDNDLSASGLQPSA